MLKFSSKINGLLSNHGVLTLPGVLRKLGLTPTEAIRIFYKQISLRGGLPFPVEIPNELTAFTLTKSRRGEDIQEFESLEAMLKNWEK